jgi:hypothetical protein
MIAQTENMMETTSQTGQLRCNSHDKDLPGERSPDAHLSEGEGVF